MPWRQATPCTADNACPNHTTVSLWGEGREVLELLWLGIHTDVKTWTSKLLMELLL